MISSRREEEDGDGQLFGAFGAFLAGARASHQLHNTHTPNRQSINHQSLSNARAVVGGCLREDDLTRRRGRCLWC